MQIYPHEANRASSWTVVIAGFLALALSFTVRGSLSLAMPLWQLEFGWSRGFVSGIAAVAMLTMAAVAPLAGAFVDRAGPRRPLMVGLAAVGGGLVMSVFAGVGAMSWLLPVGFAVVAAVGFGLIAQHVVAAAIAQQVPHNTGLATGIGTSGSTAGQLLLMPLLAAAMAGGDWRVAFIALAVGCAGLLLFVRAMLGAATVVKERRQEGGAGPGGLRQVLGSGAFHAIFWSYTICGFTTSGVIETHLMPYESLCGFPPVFGATAYGLLSGVNLAGMIAAGWLADRVHRPLLLAVIYTVRACAFVLLIFVGDSYPMLILFAVIFGLFDYSTVPVTASLIASRLGIGVLGLSMGLLSAGHAVGGAAGAWFGGVLFDRSGSYGALWLVSVALALLAALLVAGLGDPGRARIYRHSVQIDEARPAP